MRNKLYLVLNCIFLMLSFKSYAQDIVFLHHSVGANVYQQGNVASWIADYNASHNKAINLTERYFPNDPWPWSNYPYDYWKLWIGGSCNSSDQDIECLNTLAANNDMVIIKHCFPGADMRGSTGNPDVSSDYRSLENYQAQYRSLRALFDSYPDTKFMVWTLTPLHRLATFPQLAQVANSFVHWVKNEWLVEDGKSHPNIIVFDFFSLVAELSENPANGVRYCLKNEYELGHESMDSHPNEIANKYVGPIFAQAIVNAFSDNTIPVNNITVTGTDGVNNITLNGGTLQLNAAILPAYATNKTVTWSLSNGIDLASINHTGLVTALANGTVTARATANDGSGISGSLMITISNQIIKVSSISVTGANNYSTIGIPGGSLQLTATVLPADATSKTVTWSIVYGTGQASISAIGLVSALTNGTVIARAAANDGSGVSGTLMITISNQSILISSITISGVGGITSITSDNGTLQLIASVFPDEATNRAVTWSVINGTGQASISPTGLVTAIADGTVTAYATAKDGSGVFGSFNMTIGMALVKAIIVYSTGFKTSIDSIGDTLQLHTYIFPNSAGNKDVTWSVYNVSGQASINGDGLLTAEACGEVMVKATAIDNSGVSGKLNIIITDESVHTKNDEHSKITPILKINSSLIAIELKSENLYNTVYLYDLGGHVLSSHEMVSNNCVIDIASLLPGIYILQLSGRMGENQACKFIKW